MILHEDDVEFGKCYLSDENNNSCIPIDTIGGLLDVSITQECNIV